MSSYIHIHEAVGSTQLINYKFIVHIREIVGELIFNVIKSVEIYLPLFLETKTWIEAGTAFDGLQV